MNLVQLEKASAIMEEVSKYRKIIIELENLSHNNSTILIEDIWTNKTEIPDFFHYDIGQMIKSKLHNLIKIKLIEFDNL